MEHNKYKVNWGEIKFVTEVCKQTNGESVICRVAFNKDKYRIHQKLTGTDYYSTKEYCKSDNGHYRYVPRKKFNLYEEIRLLKKIIVTQDYYDEIVLLKKEHKL